MSRRNTKECIDVMQGYLDGKVIQVRDYGGKKWHITNCPLWNWDMSEYRILPEPREFWVNVYKSGDGALHDSAEEAFDALKRTDEDEYIRTMHLKEVL